MSENLFADKVKGLYQKLCKTNWDANTCGILVAVFSILIFAWSRPWGAVGAVRNWADQILYLAGIWKEAPKGILHSSSSVIGIGFVAGAFISACFGGDFAFRIPPRIEIIKAVFAGTFMGIGAALAGGCNVGGFYNSVGMLSASGFCMMAGLVVGAVIAIKYLYWEMEHISWGLGGAKTIELPGTLRILLGLAAVAAVIAGAYYYSGQDNDYVAKLSGIIVISAALGYTMQRGRWCMIQGFREPHMTGDCTMAKSVALSVCILAMGAAVLKYTALRDTVYYVRGTFGWGGLVGGLIFGFGAVLAGGCGTGTLWRVGEGQIKLWIVVPFFGLANAILVHFINMNDWEGMEEWLDDGITNAGVLGRFVYMPDTFLGYGGTLALIFLVMALWYVIVDWNEDSNKLIVPM